MDSLAWFKRFLTRGDQRFHRNDKLKFFRELDLLQFFPQWTKLADVLRLFTTVTLLPFYRADFAGFQPTTNVFFFRHGCFSASTTKIHFFVNTVPFLQIMSKIWSLGLTVIFLSLSTKLCLSSQTVPCFITVIFLGIITKFPSNHGDFRPREQ